MLDDLSLRSVELSLQGRVLLNVLHAHGVDLLVQGALRKSELSHADGLGADLKLTLCDLLIVLVKLLFLNELATSSHVLLLIELSQIE